MDAHHPPAYSPTPATLEVPFTPTTDIPFRASFGRSSMSSTTSMSHASPRGSSVRSPSVNAMDFQQPPGMRPHRLSSPDAFVPHERPPSFDLNNQLPPILNAPPPPMSEGRSEVIQTIETDGEWSNGDRINRAVSALSMDDIAAAEALGNLRAVDFAHSPSRQSSSLPRTSQVLQQPEPLLALITSQHPLLSTAINGSLSAYSSSKDYSPRFKYGAEFIERNIGTPVATTVGSVGRRTGMEDGVRWMLGGRRPSNNQTSQSGQPEVNADQDDGDGAHKRRKVGNGTSNGIYDQMDVEKGLPRHNGHRRSSEVSFQSLPAYDDNRSPSYEATQNGTLTLPQRPGTGRRSSSSNWQTRLMMTTSGLGVAMSDESLRSLKYCLTWLRWANDHLGKLIVSLKGVLHEWEEAKLSTDVEDPAALTTRITAMKSDVLTTLKKVIDIVSKYAGGALPENARTLVRKHLTSLPQRWSIAAKSQKDSVKVGNGEGASTSEEQATGGNETVLSARRVLVLATEGLDMMAQVSAVVDGTITSAEEWCEKLGRRSAPGRGDDAQMTLPPAEAAVPMAVDVKDVKMIDSDSAVVPPVQMPLNAEKRDLMMIDSVN